MSILTSLNGNEKALIVLDRKILTKYSYWDRGQDRGVGQVYLIAKNFADREYFLISYFWCRWQSKGTKAPVLSRTTTIRMRSMNIDAVKKILIKEVEEKMQKKTKLSYSIINPKDDIGIHCQYSAGGKKLRLLPRVGEVILIDEKKTKKIYKNKYPDGGLVQYKILGVMLYLKRKILNEVNFNKLIEKFNWD